MQHIPPSWWRPLPLHNVVVKCFFRTQCIALQARLFVIVHSWRFAPHQCLGICFRDLALEGQSPFPPNFCPYSPCFSPLPKLQSKLILSSFDCVSPIYMHKSILILYDYFWKLFESNARALATSATGFLLHHSLYFARPYFHASQNAKAALMAKALNRCYLSWRTFFTLFRDFIWRETDIF